VFCFFGLVAVLGTVYVQAHDKLAVAPGVHYLACVSFHSDLRDATCTGASSVWPAAWWAAVGVGAIACAILVANNLRDIPTDVGAGKMTLAVRLGDRRTRLFYAALVVVALGSLVGVASTTDLLALVALVAFVPLGRATFTVLRGAAGPQLIRVLKLTGTGELVYGAALFIGLLVAR